VHRHLLGLPLRHLPTAGTRQMIHRLVERSPDDLPYHHLAQSVRVLVRWQLQLRIQGEDTVQTSPPITQAGDDHLSETRFHEPLTAFAPVGPRDSILAHRALANGLLDT
jgi:hypothetical protein